VDERFRRLRQHEVSLALAVKLVDAVSGRSLGSAPTVSIDGVHAEPTLNPSDYWLFLSPPVSLPDDSVEVTVETGWQYVDATYTVPADDDVSLDDLEPPAVVLEVFPAVDYDFGAAATVVLGRVEHAGDPVEGATVSLAGTDLRTRTDSDGSFALAVEGIVRSPEATSEPLRVDPAEDPPRPVSVYDGGTSSPPQLSVEHDDLGPATESITILEGVRTELPSAINL